MIGCSNESGTPGTSGTQSIVSENESSATELTYHNYDINLYPRNKLVCDPFNDERTTDTQYGIKASLFYLPTGSQKYTSVDEYIEKGIASQTPLFFTNLFVPTRAFSKGFSTMGGDVVRDNENNMLIEYFGIEFESQLTLPPELEEGHYDLATLSDDGSLVRLFINNQWITLINNDGNHPTRMGCSTTSIYLNHSSRFPMKIRYYQGPRHHIAHVLLWRKVESHNLDPLCGAQGNTYFFNSNLDSIPLQPYQDLLNRNWSPLPPKAFILNQQTDYNPCVESEVPEITDLKVEIMDSEFVLLNWTTDILATSHLEITDLETGEITLTTSDNALRTAQHVFIYGLTLGHTYRIKAISVGEALGQTISEPIEFTYNY